jgi:hypothetical protein
MLHPIYIFKSIFAKKKFGPACGPIDEADAGLDDGKNQRR